MEHQKLWIRLRRINGMREFDNYFKMKHDAVGMAGFSSIQKRIATIRMLAYGAHADA
jgi:hypothetical protein